MGAMSFVNVGAAEGTGEFAHWPNANAADSRRTRVNTNRPFISRVPPGEMELDREYKQEDKTPQPNREGVRRVSTGGTRFPGLILSCPLIPLLVTPHPRTLFSCFQAIPHSLASVPGSGRMFCQSRQLSRSFSEP